MNQYPVKTTIGGRIIRNCRLVATDHTSTLGQWDREAGAATVLVEVPAAPQRIGASQRWKVGEVVIEPQRGCGCQHPMYGFVPPAPA